MTLQVPVREVAGIGACDAMPLTSRSAVPSFVTVTFWTGPLEPTRRPAKDRPSGLKATSGPELFS